MSKHTAIALGDYGVELTMIAHTKHGLIDDVLPLNRKPAPGYETADQHIEFQRILGCARRELIGMPSTGFRVFNYRTKFMQAAFETEAQNDFAGRYYSDPVTLIGDDGVRLTVVAEVADGKVDSVFAIHVDPCTFEGSSSRQKDEQDRLLRLARSLLVGMSLSQISHLCDHIDGKAVIDTRPVSRRYAAGGYVRPSHEQKWPHECSVKLFNTDHVIPRKHAARLVEGFRKLHPKIVEARNACVSKETAACLGLFDLKRNYGREGELEKSNAAPVDSAEAPARTPSNTLGRVIKEMRDRENFGLGKYGTTVDRTDLTMRQWLQHAKEEAMDSVMYLDRLIQKFDEEEKPKTNITVEITGKVEAMKDAISRSTAALGKAARRAGFAAELGMPYGGKLRDYKRQYCNSIREGKSLNSDDEFVLYCMNDVYFERSLREAMFDPPVFNVDYDMPVFNVGFYTELNKRGHFRGPAFDDCRMPKRTASFPGAYGCASTHFYDTRLFA